MYRCFRLIILFNKDYRCDLTSIEEISYIVKWSMASFHLVSGVWNSITTFETSYIFLIFLFYILKIKGATIEVGIL